MMVEMLRQHLLVEDTLYVWRQLCSYHDSSRLDS
jgi:hypothetical protein